jgi:hypothetical protein
MITNSTTAVRMLPPTIMKNFYIHEAPRDDDEDETETQQREIIVKPKIRYNIVFVKTPYERLKKPEIPILHQNQEKTIIYVLSRKNEVSEQENKYPTPPTAPTSKPEVFYIQYRNGKSSNKDTLDSTLESTSPKSQVEMTTTEIEVGNEEETETQTTIINEEIE